MQLSAVPGKATSDAYYEQYTGVWGLHNALCLSHSNGAALRMMYLVKQHVKGQLCLQRQIEVNRQKRNAVPRRTWEHAQLAKLDFPGRLDHRMITTVMCALNTCCTQHGAYTMHTLNM